MVTSKTLSLLVNNFNQLTPYAVGFDRVFDQLNTYARNNATSTGFPPYNIRKAGKDKYAIEVAVAGFNKDDVEVEYEDNLLTVKTKEVKRSEEKDGDEVIHRGISQRSFARSFTIADDVKVNGAELKDGLLTISCEKIIPEIKKKRLIEIK